MENNPAKYKLLNQLCQKHKVVIDPNTDMGNMILEFAELSWRFHKTRIKSLAHTHKKYLAAIEDRAMENSREREEYDSVFGYDVNN
jgi:hypothetical protein